MHVRRRDTNDKIRRWSQAAQIDDVHVKDLTEERCIRSEAPPPKAAANNDLGSAPLRIARIKRFAHQPHAANLEELRRDPSSPQPLGTIPSAQVNPLPSIAGP